MAQRRGLDRPAWHARAHLGRTKLASRTACTGREGVAGARAAGGNLQQGSGDSPQATSAFAGRSGTSRGDGRGGGRRMARAAGGGGDQLRLWRLQQLPHGDAAALRDAIGDGHRRSRWGAGRAAARARRKPARRPGRRERRAGGLRRAAGRRLRGARAGPCRRRDARGGARRRQARLLWARCCTGGRARDRRRSPPGEAASSLHAARDARRAAPGDAGADRADLVVEDSGTLDGSPWPSPPPPRGTLVLKSTSTQTALVDPRC